MPICVHQINPGCVPTLVFCYAYGSAVSLILQCNSYKQQCIFPGTLQLKLQYVKVLERRMVFLWSSFGGVSEEGKMDFCIKSLKSLTVHVNNISTVFHFNDPLCTKGPY